jgi:hypothetical protein
MQFDVHLLFITILNKIQVTGRKWGALGRILKIKFSPTAQIQQIWLSEPRSAILHQRSPSTHFHTLPSHYYSSWQKQTIKMFNCMQ